MSKKLKDVRFAKASDVMQKNVVFVEGKARWPTPSRP